MDKVIRQWTRGMSQFTQIVNTWTWRDIEHYKNHWLSSTKIKAPQQRIILCEPNGPQLIAKLWGLWEQKSIPCLLPLNMPEEQKSECVKTIINHRISDHEDEALVLFTSGTSSSIPKGVRLSHTNLKSHLYMLDDHVPSDFVGYSDVSLATLPWSHCYGLMGECFSMLHRGAHIHCLPPHKQKRFDAKQWWTHIHKTQPTILFLVPRILETILSIDRQIRPYFPFPKQRRMFWFGQKLRYIMSGGARLDPHIQMEFEHELSVLIYQGYGCTEMSPMISLQTEYHTHQTSDKGINVGRLLPHIQLQHTEQGEILVNGPNRFIGYIGEDLRPSNQWYHTNDGGYMKNGHLYLIGRLGHQIKLKNGKFISLAQMEKKAKDSVPKIQQIVIWQSKNNFKAIIYPRLSSNNLHLYGENIQLVFSDTPFLSIERNTMTIKGEPCRPKIQQLYDHQL